MSLRVDWVILEYIPTSRLGNFGVRLRVDWVILEYDTLAQILYDCKAWISTQNIMEI